MRVVLAPDSFKGSISAQNAAAALAAGWRERRPGDELIALPLADGGEGTIDALAAAHPGARCRAEQVVGPAGRQVRARWVSLPDGTAVVELAEASGLPLLDRPDSLGAHTYGLGQMIAATAGCRALLIGLGGSASTDGGTGALRALGARLLDDAGNDLALGGGALTDLATIDLRSLPDPPAGGVRCLVDVDAPLLGERGAARVFGPQKGASPTDVALLERGLGVLARKLGGAPEAAGSGAAGGTAYGLAAAWGAVVVPGATTVAEAVGLPSALAVADVVVTGEGRYDATSRTGKVVGTVLATVGPRLPVMLAVGQLAADPPETVAASVALADLAGSSRGALAEPERWLRAAGRALAEAGWPISDISRH